MCYRQNKDTYARAHEKHLKDLKERGTIIVDEDAVEHIPKTKARVFRIRASDTAKKLFKSRLYGNMVMLGALTKITGIVKEEAVEKAITNSVPETARGANIRGFREGLKLVAM